MTELKEGQMAPAFTAKDQEGNDVSLAQFAGKTVVLYFYPKDDTPGCTAEACDFRDNYQGLSAKDIVVLGVSVDDEKSHKKFIAKHSLPFTLLADTDKKIVEAYGVWGE
jgi:peroxiredoxin Q/BCP